MCQGNNGNEYLVSAGDYHTHVKITIIIIIIIKRED